MLTIDIIGNRIKAKFQAPPGLDVQQVLLGIPGGNENKRGDTWSYPINMTVCEAFRDAFGDDLVIGDNLWKWAEDFRKREAIVRSAQNAQEDDDRSPEQVLPGVMKYAPDLFRDVADRWYQVEGANALANARRMILADQPGLGKTYQSLAGVLEHFYSQGNFSPLILVLAPSTVVTTNWEPTILDKVPGCFVYSMTGSRKQREQCLEDIIEEYDADDDPGPRFALGNPEMARITVWYKCFHKEERNGPICGKEWVHKDEMTTDAEGAPVAKACLDPEHKRKKKHRLMEEASYEPMLQIAWDAIILDESQKVLITKSSKKIKMTMQRRGMTRLRAPMMFALSGTPYRGRPERLWGTLNWLDPQGYPSYRKWLDSNFHVQEFEHHDGYEVGGLNAESEEAFLKAQGAVMLRRTKGEVADQLPPKQYSGWWLDPEQQYPGGHGIWLPMEGAQARAYKQMRDDAVAAIDGGTLNAVGVLAEMTRLRQFACSAAKMIADGKDGQYVQPVLPSNKLNWTEDFLDTLEGKVVIVSQFTGLLDMFELVLRKQTERKDAYRKDWGRIVKVTGAVTGKKRTQAVTDFQNDPDTRIMLLNLNAGGVGITIDAADDMIMLDEPYIPDDAEQAEDRIHRISRYHNVTIHYLRSLGTIEEQIARTTGGRDVIQKRLLDGARGIQFARTLVAGR